MTDATAPDLPAPDAVAAQPRRRLAHRAVGWALAVVTTVIVMVEQRDVGIARDEVVYIQNGARYASWWLGLIRFEHGITEASVTQTFGGPNATDNNREHPPLMKTLFGLSDWLLHRTLDVTDEVTASRLPSAIMHGVAVALVYAFALELWGLAQAVLAALLLALLPRAVFHAGLACFDAPTMTLWFATVYAYWRALDGRRWPWQVGVVWGLALATKHTALLLPFALGAHYLLVAWRARNQAPRRAVVWAVLGYRGRILISLAVLGPLTLYVVWPWLWFDPVRHVASWLAFHTGHVHYNYEYLGHSWNAPRFPWHVALVTTLFTVPVATLVAALAGAGAWLSGHGLAARPGAPARLLGLSAAASIGPFLLGTTPIFGAEKHWMPVLPTICIAAAVGIVWLARMLADYVAAFRRGARPLRAIAIAAIGGCVVLASVAELRAASPYALTWYNALAGGAPGGADLGMNRQFWGVSARGALPTLAAAAAPTGTTYVYTHDAAPAWGLYQRLGLVPRTLADAGWEQSGVDRSGLAIVIHERHFNRHDFLVWRSYGTVQPIYVLRAAGVPIVSVYRRPPKPGDLR